MNGLIGLAGTLALLLAAGAAIGLVQRGGVAWRWLFVAALLVAINDALLTRLYHLLPRIPGTGSWNWEGKLLALAVTLAIAALPAFGWRRAGLTLHQEPGSMRSCIPVVLIYCLFFVGIALAFPSGPAAGDEIAFQLTMPGLEEEPFYRGILLLALDRAFTGRVRWLGVEWGWGAILSSALFGLAHAFGYGHGHFSFDAMTMALTALPALLAVWLRLRTGSVLLPILIHNFGNAIGLLL